MDLTIKAWVVQEHNAFENFSAPIASRFEEGITRAISERMKQLLKKNGKAEIALPWGTYYAEVVSKGEAGNITPTWEPSKGFIKILNGENMDNAEKSECVNQDEFDPEYIKLVRDFIAYGFFNPEAPENKDKIDRNKCVRLSDEEVDYFLNEYALVLANIARDKQRDGKIFRLEINNSYPHGWFDFEYDDDEIKVSWTADKVFKQILKDDEAAAKAAEADFTPMTEGRTVIRDKATGEIIERRG